MDKEYRNLKLPNAGQGGIMVEIPVEDIISMEIPKDSTVVDLETGIVYEIEIEKHTLIYVKSYKKSGNYEYYIPLSLKEMIELINSEATYYKYVLNK